MINLPRYVGSTAASLRRFGDSAAIRQQATMLLTKPGTTADTTLSAMCSRPEFCILAKNWGVSWQNRQVPHQNPTISIKINIHQYPTPSGSFWNVCLLHLQNGNLPPTVAGCLSHNLFQGLLWCSRSEVRSPKRSTVTLRAWRLTVGGEAQDGFSGRISSIWMPLDHLDLDGFGIDLDRSPKNHEKPEGQKTRKFLVENHDIHDAPRPIGLRLCCRGS